MKKIVIIIAVCAAAYMGFFRQDSKDYQGEPYVHIYGRDSYSLTQNMKKELRAMVQSRQVQLLKR